MTEGDKLCMVKGDDVIRAWIDGQQFVNRPGSHAETVIRRHVDGGQHEIRVDFVEFTGNAIVRFTWDDAD